MASSNDNERYFTISRIGGSPSDAVLCHTQDTSLGWWGSYLSTRHSKCILSPTNRVGNLLKKGLKEVSEEIKSFNLKKLNLVLSHTCKSLFLKKLLNNKSISSLWTARKQLSLLYSFLFILCEIVLVYWLLNLWLIICDGYVHHTNQILWKTGSK